MINAGDIFHASLKGHDRRFIILTSPDQDDGKVLFILEGDTSDPFVELASELEAVVYGKGCRNSWYCGERLTVADLKDLQDEILESGAGKYYKNYIHKYRIRHT